MPCISDRELSALLRVDFLRIPTDPDSLLVALLAILTSAAILFFATGLHPLWWLLWFVLIPVLLAAPRLSRSAAFAGHLSLMRSTVSICGATFATLYLRHSSSRF